MKPIRVKGNKDLTVNSDGDAYITFRIFGVAFYLFLPRQSLKMAAEMSDDSVAEDDLTNVIKFPRWRT